MHKLVADRIEYLVVHTAAAPGDPSIQDIDRWHRDRGWECCGYHFVIRRDGRLEVGRSTEYQGAHVRGLNARSLGVCCSGNGDVEPFTEAQIEALIRLAVRLRLVYGIEPERMIGHREAYRLVPPEMRESKTCPGRKVDMDELRDRFREAVRDWPTPDIVEPTQEGPALG